MQSSSAGGSNPTVQDLIEQIVTLERQKWTLLSEELTKQTASSSASNNANQSQNEILLKKLQQRRTLLTNEVRLLQEPEEVVEDDAADIDVLDDDAHKVTSATADTSDGNEDTESIRDSEEISLLNRHMLRMIRQNSNPKDKPLAYRAKPLYTLPNTINYGLLFPDTKPTSIISPDKDIPLSKDTRQRVRSIRLVTNRMSVSSQPGEEVLSEDEPDEAVDHDEDLATTSIPDHYSPEREDSATMHARSQTPDDLPSGNPKTYSMYSEMSNTANNSVDTSIEFCIVGADWDVLMKEQSLVTPLVTPKLEWRYPLKVNEQVSNTKDIQEQNFFFPSGVKVELVSKAVMEVKTRLYNFKRHIVPFSNRKGIPLYASCLTIIQAYSVEEIKSKDRKILLNLVRNYKSEYAAKCIQKTYRKYLEYKKLKEWMTIDPNDASAKLFAQKQRPSISTRESFQAVDASGRTSFLKSHSTSEHHLFHSLTPTNSTTGGSTNGSMSNNTPQKTGFFSKLFRRNSASQPSSTSTTPHATAASNSHTQAVFGAAHPPLLAPIGEGSSHGVASTGLSLSAHDSSKLVQSIPEVGQEDSVDQSGDTADSDANNVPSISTDYDSNSIKSLSSGLTSPINYSEKVMPEEEPLKDGVMREADQSTDEQVDSAPPKVVDPDDALLASFDFSNKVIVGQKVYCIISPTPEYTFIFTVLDAIAEAEYRLNQRIQENLKQYTTEEITELRCRFLTQVEIYIEEYLSHPACHLQDLSNNFAVARRTYGSKLNILHRSDRLGTKNMILDKFLGREIRGGDGGNGIKLVKRKNRNADENMSIHSWSDMEDISTTNDLSPALRINTGSAGNGSSPRAHQSPKRSSINSRSRRLSESSIMLTGSVNGNTNNEVNNNIRGQSLHEVNRCSIRVREYINKTMSIDMNQLLSTKEWSCAVLFSHLNATIVFKIINLLLMEKSLVIYGTNPGVVTAITMGVVNLISPFIWEGIFVPLVPDAARALFEAPVPLIIGTVYPPKPADVSPGTAILHLNDDIANIKLQVAVPKPATAASSTLSPEAATQSTAQDNAPKIKEMEFMSWFVRLPEVSADMPIDEEISKRINHTRKLLNHFIKDKIHIVNNELVLSLQNLEKQEASKHGAHTPDPSHRAPRLANTRKVYDRNFTVKNNTDRLLMSHLPGSIVNQLRVLLSSIKRYNYSFFGALVNDPSAWRRFIRKPFQSSNGLQPGAMYFDGEMEEDFIPAEQFLEPLRNQLEFQEAMVKTQLFVSFMDRLRKEHLMLDHIR